MLDANIYMSSGQYKCFPHKYNVAINYTLQRSEVHITQSGHQIFLLTTPLAIHNPVEIIQVSNQLDAYLRCCKNYNPPIILHI